MSSEITFMLRSLARYVDVVVNGERRMKESKQVVLERLAHIFLKVLMAHFSYVGSVGCVRREREEIVDRFKDFFSPCVNLSTFLSFVSNVSKFRSKVSQPPWITRFKWNKIFSDNSREL